MKESLEKEIYPGIQRQMETRARQDVEFQFLIRRLRNGHQSDPAGRTGRRRDILDRSRCAAACGRQGYDDRLAHIPKQGHRQQDAFRDPCPQGNPKGHQDFADLGKPGIKVIHPDPVSSGGAQWSILAIYGSELKKSEAETGTAGHGPGTATRCKAIWNNVISTPGSAREARTQFETGYGDALVTYELEPC